MNTLQFFQTYADRIWTGLCFMAIVAFFLAWSIIDNVKLTRRKVPERKIRLKYHLRRVPYICGCLICIAISDSMAFSAMPGGYGAIPVYEASFLYDAIMLVVYFCALFCLYQLEAGAALFVALFLCLPVVYLLERYFSAGVTAAGVMVVGVMICAMLWRKRGNRLAKKYLGLGSVWDLKTV